MIIVYIAVYTSYHLQVTGRSTIMYNCGAEAILVLQHGVVGLGVAGVDVGCQIYEIDVDLLK